MLEIVLFCRYCWVKMLMFLFMYFFFVNLGIVREMIMRLLSLIMVVIIILNEGST